VRNALRLRQPLLRLAQLLLVALPAGDVGAGAEPPHDLPVISVLRDCAREDPVVLAVGAEHA
jgi:hypothetical protein